MEEVLKAVSGTVPIDGGDAGQGKSDNKALRDLLYSVENLRKRPGAED